MKKLLSLFGFLSLMILFPFMVEAAVGKFTYIKGRVDVTSQGQKARPVKVGDEVNIGDIIRAKSKSKAEVTFTDGNILRVAASTRVEISDYMAGKEQTNIIIKLFRGKIQNNVKKVLGRIFGRKMAHRFEVRTPTFVCGVRGTTFFTYYERGVSGAIFKEGTGYGFSMNRPDQVVFTEAGQSMVVVSPDIPPTIKPVTDMEMEVYERETSPYEEGEEDNEKSEIPTVGKEITDILKKEDTTNQTGIGKFINDGVSEKASGIEALKKGIDIPQQVPSITKEFERKPIPQPPPTPTPPPTPDPAPRR